MMGGGLIDARGADAQGNLYFQGMALNFEEGEGPDSVPIMRWHPSKTTIDTVAWMPVTADMRPRVQRDAGRTTVTVRMGGGSAWAKQTQWVTAPDGRIALITPEPYQVTWLTGSTRSAGPVVPFTPIKVTDAEKKEYVARVARTRPTVMTFGGGRGGPPPRIDPPRMEEIDFPETMPAFSGRDAVLITPEGEVWVSRLRAASDKTPRYDVFDQKGTAGRRSHPSFREPGGWIRQRHGVRDSKRRRRSPVPGALHPPCENGSVSRTGRKAGS